MKLNKSMLFSLIGLVAFLALAVIAATLIGFQEKSFFGSSRSIITLDELQKIAKEHSDAKVSLGDNYYLGTFLMWIFGIISIILAGIFLGLRLIDNDRLDFIMIILTVVFATIGLVLMIAGTAYFTDKSVPSGYKLKDIFSQGAIAGLYVVYILGGAAGITLSAMSFKWRND